MSSTQDPSDNATGLKPRIKKASPSSQATDGTNHTPSMRDQTPSTVPDPPRQLLPAPAPIPQTTATQHDGKRKANQLANSDNEDEETGGPVVKKQRFANNSPTIVVANGDPGNLPDTAKFSYKFNGKLHKVKIARPMRTNSNLTKRITAHNRDLLEFTVVDVDRQSWSFKYADSDNADWDDNDWVEEANKWFRSIMARCFDADEALAGGDQKTNNQWSTMEITTLKSLVLTQMRRARGTLIDQDWKVVGGRLNLIFKGTTQPAGTVLASARGQALTADKPFVVTKEARVLSGRSSKSLPSVLNRFEDKKISVWQAKMLKEAESLGWLDEDTTADGYKVVFRVVDESAASSDGEGVTYYKYETKVGEEVGVETDKEGELVCVNGGQKVLVLGEGDDDDTDDDPENRREAIDEEVQRMLADPEISVGLASKSAITVKAEYEKILEKAEEKLKGKGKGKAVEEEAVDEEEENIEEEVADDVDVEMKGDAVVEREMN